MRKRSLRLSGQPIREVGVSCHSTGHIREEIVHMGLSQALQQGRV